MNIVKVLIIEDEPPIARELARLTQRLLDIPKIEIYTEHTISGAFQLLKSIPVDLCLLDLQLGTKDGYDVLRNTMAGAFHTIIISAHVDRAQEAFDYGVLDFVPKPVNADRLKIAFNRFTGSQKIDNPGIKFLIVRKRNTNLVLPVEDVNYFKAVGYLVEIHLKSGNVELYDKPLNRLEQILPSGFIRTHRSYIVNTTCITKYQHKGHASYLVLLQNNEYLPLSSSHFKTFKTFLSSLAG